MQRVTWRFILRPFQFRDDKKCCPASLRPWRRWERFPETARLGGTSVLLVFPVTVTLDFVYRYINTCWCSIGEHKLVHTHWTCVVTHSNTLLRLPPFPSSFLPNALSHTYRDPTPGPALSLSPTVSLSLSLSLALALSLSPAFSSPPD